MRSKHRWLGNERVRLALLLALLAGLGAYALTSSAVLGGEGSDLAECPQSGAPEVRTTSRDRVRALRSGVRRVVFFAPGLQPYEEGPAAAGFAWSDGEPGTHRAVPAEPRQPGAWEMRWWMPTRDDVVVDAFLFADGAHARDFLRRATSTECRRAARSVPASFPPNGRNLAWLNPDGFAQEDLFLQRGRRVYRIGVVRPGSEGRASGAERRLGFEIANALGCSLPGARCLLRPQSSVSAGFARPS